MQKLPGNSEQAQIPDVSQIKFNSSSKSTVLVSDKQKELEINEAMKWFNFFSWYFEQIIRLWWMN